MAGKNRFIDTKKQHEFGKDYVKILIALLKKEGKDSSGALINSINYKLKDDAEEILIAIEANDYLKWVDEGRKPGTYPNIRAISEWTRIKGIDQKAVFPISHNIFKFGIEPTNVISRTIKEIETSPTLNRKFEDEISENLEKTIIDFIENNK